MAFAELGGELVAPLITIDSRIAITPRNVSNKHIQDFMVERGAILRVTEDGRVGLQTPRGTSLLGFDDFLFRREVDVNNPHALDEVPKIKITPSDPLTLAKRRHLKDLQRALRRKDWDKPIKSDAVRPPPKIEVMVDEKKDQDKQIPRHRAVMLTLFNIFKQTAAMVNTYIFEPTRRAMRSFYVNGMHPTINWLFGQIGHKDEYDQAEQEVRMLLSESQEQKTVLEVPEDAVQPKQNMVWRHSNDRATSSYTVQNTLSSGPKIVVTSPFTNKLRAN